MIDIEQIRELLPHRYPFLLIDRVTEVSEDGDHILAYKNVTANEPFFEGHFPELSVMPGVLIVEALAQATGILAALKNAKADKKMLYYFVGIDNARFRRTVVPGDKLVLEADWKWVRRGIGRFATVAKVDDEVVATADVMCAQRELPGD